MIELRQQVTADVRRQPIDTDRVYRDGKAVGLVGRHNNAVLCLFKRMPDADIEALVEAVNASREAGGKFGPLKGYTQPVSRNRIEALRRQVQQHDDTDDFDDE